MGWEAMIFLRKTGWHWHMLCLPSDVLPLEWVHPINSVQAFCLVPKVFLQPGFNIKTPSRPSYISAPNMLSKPSPKVPGTQNRTEKSRGLPGFTLMHGCRWLEGNTRRNIFPTGLKTCGCLLVAAAPLQKQKQEQEQVTTFHSKRLFRNSPVGRTDLHAFCIATHIHQGFRIRANTVLKQ